MTIGGAFAQDQKNVVQAGIGFGTTYSTAGYGDLKGMPTLNFTYERILPFKVGPGYFGAGITASYRSTKSQFTELDYEDVEVNRKWKHNTSVIALRGAYHLNNDLIKVKTSICTALCSWARASRAISITAGPIMAT